MLLSDVCQTDWVLSHCSLMFAYLTWAAVSLCSLIPSLDTVHK